MKEKHVLGVSAFYHDSAAALISDGRIIAAAQEERFSRKKHDPSIPKKAINYCLEEAFIEPDELSAVVFYDNSVLTIERAIRSIASGSPRSFDIWANSATTLLGVKPFISNMLRDVLQTDVPILFSKHHSSHAASAFYPSPFKDAAVLTIDGVGEWATTSVYLGRGSKLKSLKEIKYPHSLGLLYSAFTYFTGFKVNSGEYKLMGLAPYGEPEYVDIILENIVHINKDGSYRLNLDFFGFIDGNLMTNDRFAELFNGPARKPESPITRREMNLAASIQSITEMIVIALARHTRELTNCTNLCLAGGVALNCVANGKLHRENLFDKIWVQPAAGDAGGAIGAALIASYQKFGCKRHIDKRGIDTQSGSYLGPSYTHEEIKAFLDRHNYPNVHEPDPHKLAIQIANLLSEGKVVGILNGRMEFGPRALGARSILGDPRSPKTQTVMNLKIKYRESFRPFAPSVLRERVADFFEFEDDSPYMLQVAPVIKKRRIINVTNSKEDNLLVIVSKARSDIPAVTHVDYSARIQTVDAQNNAFYHSVISEFEKLTGVGLVVNTSFNVRGEPIVCSPKDAYQCFMRTEMDALILEQCLLLKEDQPKTQDDQKWKQEYELD